jgi:hypothetical protein
MKTGANIRHSAACDFSPAIQRREAMMKLTGGAYATIESCDVRIASAVRVRSRVVGEGF